MRRVKILMTALFAVLVGQAFAQDLSDPKYAKWGENVDERKENMLANSYLKEELGNKNFNLAAAYLQKLLEKCPAASENIYVNGVTLYKNKINRAQSVAEKNVYVDSLLMLYDVRLANFGSHPKRGRDYILERKAKEVLTYRESDRDAVRSAFEAAIKAQVEMTGTADPELVAIYFKNLCDDFSNDLVDAMCIVSTYDDCAKYFENIAPEKSDFKDQFEKCFAMSGAASCDNIEAIFSKKLEGDPNNETILSQAMGLLSRAKCQSAFAMSVGERYYAVNPSSNVAMYLAQLFQDSKDFAKANKYLREALAKETVDSEREQLFVRIGILEMTASNYQGAVAAFRDARAINPENALAQYFLAQCYVFGIKNCSELAKGGTYLVAYDMIQQAIPGLEASAPDQVENAKKLAASYRTGFPTSEECFFNELKEGDSYTVNCGFVAGIATRIRFRPQ